MPKKISPIRKWLLYPESWIGWVIAILFILAFIFSEYLLYIISATIIATILFLIFGSKYLKEQRYKDYLYRFIFLIFFISGIYLMLSNRIGLGLLLWIIGFIVGIKGMAKYRSKEMMRSTYYVTYNLAPILYVMGPILFIMMLLIGFKENRIDVPIGGFIFAIILISIGLWSRKRMKQELNKKQKS